MLDVTAVQNLTFTQEDHYRQIGDNTALGSVQTHAVREGDTLKGIAAAYYGSGAYWYLIADANALTGAETLKEGTTLTIPNASAASLNPNDAFAVYNAADIIGGTSPELAVSRVTQKKSFLQKLIQVIIIVIIVVVAYYLIEFATAAFQAAIGTGTTGSGLISGAGKEFGLSIAKAFGAVGSIGAIAATGVALAGVGYGVGLVTGTATQGLAILAGLQEEFDWKGIRDMGKSFSISAVAGGVGGWAAKSQDALTLPKTLIRAGAAAAGQYLKDGNVRNVAGVLAAMIPAADRVKGVSEASNWWGDGIGQFLRSNKFAVTTGLEILEARLEDQTYHTLDWANVASNAMTEALTGQDAQRYANKDGTFSWSKLTTEALIAGVGSLILNKKYGEDAGLSFLGNKLGTITVGVIESNAEIANTLRQQAKALEQLAASLVTFLPTEPPVSAGSTGPVDLSTITDPDDRRAEALAQLTLPTRYGLFGEPVPSDEEELLGGRRIGIGYKMPKGMPNGIAFHQTPEGLLGPADGGGATTGVTPTSGDDAFFGPDVETAQQFINRIRGQIRTNQPVNAEEYERLAYTLRDRGYAVPRETFDRQGFYTYPVEGEVTIARNTLVARSVNDFAARTEDQNEARFQFNLRTGLSRNLEQVGNTEARYVDVTRYLGPTQGERTVRLYFQQDAAQLARENPNRSARITTDEALLNKMEIAPYEATVNAAFATRNVSEVGISGAGRPTGEPHASGRGLDISYINVQTQQGVAQRLPFRATNWDYGGTRDPNSAYNTGLIDQNRLGPGNTEGEYRTQFTNNLRAQAGVTQAIGPWRYSGALGATNGFLPSLLTNVSTIPGYIPGATYQQQPRPVQQAIRDNQLLIDHRHHLHITTRR